MSSQASLPAFSQLLCPKCIFSLLPVLSKELLFTHRSIPAAQATSPHLCSSSELLDLQMCMAFSLFPFFSRAICIWLQILKGVPLEAAFTEEV